jgi:hypothetical protein
MSSIDDHVEKAHKKFVDDEASKVRKEKDRLSRLEKPVNDVERTRLLIEEIEEKLRQYEHKQYQVLAGNHKMNSWGTRLFTTHSVVSINDFTYREHYSKGTGSHETGSSGRSFTQFFNYKGIESVITFSTMTQKNLNPAKLLYVKELDLSVPHELVHDLIERKNLIPKLEAAKRTYHHFYRCK